MTWILTTILVVAALIIAVYLVARGTPSVGSDNPRVAASRFTVVAIGMIIVGIPLISAAFYYGCQAAPTFQ